MGIIIPLETDVYNDFVADVLFVRRQSANYDLEATVDFNNVNSGSGGPPAINALTGSISDLAIDDGSTVLTTTVGSNGGIFYGMQASGDTDGKYELYLNNNRLFRFFTNQIVPQVEYSLPAPLKLYSGDIVSLNVTNTGLASAGYEGTFLGVFS